MSSNRNHSNAYAHKYLSQRRGVSKRRGGTASILVVVVGVAFVATWLSFFFYISLQHDRNINTVNSVNVNPLSATTAHVHVPVNAHAHAHAHASTDSGKDKAYEHPHLRKIHSQRDNQQPIPILSRSVEPIPTDVITNQQQNLSRKVAITFPPKFPIMTRNHTFNKDTMDMCDRTLWHTLATTTIVMPGGDTFIHTGDINDLWLRDSAAQIHPLLVPFSSTQPPLVASDARLTRVVSGLIQRTAMYIRHDPYANAFRIDDTYHFSPSQKLLGRHDLIATWNYELDSACYYIRMLYYFYKALPDHSVLRLTRVHEAIQIMLDVWTSEQNHEENAFPNGTLLDCQNCGKPYRYAELPRNGKGSVVAHTGMTWSGFRPSDDACTYGYLVPANMFAVVALAYVEELAPVLWNDEALARKAKKLAAEIDQGIQQHGIVDHPKYGRIYAYEVDGLGNKLLMDDANVPSLMSIPYLGYNYDPVIYHQTRRFILSPDNPTYQKGTNSATGDIEGYGSPHMNARIRANIWPMSLAMQALTSSNVTEKLHLVDQLTKATGGTGWMHESFDVSNPTRYTREWFCWADSLFAELVMTMTDACPQSSYEIMSWKDPIDVP